MERVSAPNVTRAPSKFTLLVEGIKCTHKWLSKRRNNLYGFDKIADACSPATKEAAAAAVGKAVLATRGECSFLEKAEAVDVGPSGRVGALIVTNSETSLFHMGASPRWEHIIKFNLHISSHDGREPHEVQPDIYLA